MKRTLVILAGAALILAAAVPASFAQKAEKVDLTGTWTGYTFLGDGSRADFNLILEKTEAGYTGKITDETGMLPEMPLKNTSFSEGTLTFQIDYPSGMDIALISIELKHEADTLKGHWTDPDGESNIIELQRKK
jgi:hypothetical protein